MYLIDRIAHTNHWAKKPTAEKLIITLGGLVVCLTGPPAVAGSLIFLMMSALALCAAHLPMRVFLAILALPIGFLLAGTPMLLLSVDPEHGFAVAWRPDQLPLAIGLVCRAAGAVSCLTLLILTTPVHAMIPCLRRIGIPAFVVEIMLLTYRLIFVFAETAARGYQAQNARLGYVGWKQSIHSLGMLAAALFQRAMERAKHMEIGLAARGFEGNLPVLPEDGPTLSAVRSILLVLGLSLILAISFFAEHLVYV